MTAYISRAWAGGAGSLVAVGTLFHSELLIALGLLLGLVLLISWGWARWCLQDLTVQRGFSQSRAFFGESVDMVHIFSNNKPLPLPWIFVEDRFPATLQMESTSVGYT